MAEEREPPPLFDTVDITKKEEDNDDLFTSAIEDVSLEDEKRVPFRDVDAPTLQLSEDNPTYETPPVERPSVLKSNSLEEVEKENDDQFLEVSVTDPQKVGDGMGAYVAYKVVTRTNIRLFKKTHFDVMRRFSDFLGLHDKLVEKYLRLGRIIPPAPEKSVIGMTKIKMSNQAEQGSSAEFIEKRRASLERYLNRTAAHPVLCVDPDFREFLEADMDLPKATNTSALSGAGVMRLFNKVGETVNKITYKMDENDPWFEEKTQQVENLDLQLRKLHTSVELLVLHRKDLATLTSSFAKSAAMLGNCEEHTSLSRALAQLADVEEKVEALYNEQANSDFSIFCELLKDYVALFGAIKEVFHERVKVYQNWQHSQQMLNKKREQKAKLELSGKSDKGVQAGMEVVEWESKVERGQEEFDNISKMIKKELERFEINRVKDFKAIIIQYLENLMNNQLQLIKYWEAFMPEAKAIA
ncbi:sorting nexin-2 [Schistocerca americana]|uniref:sorting nexin-2 n=1 Tax=Schistocerca americana TaxID=7009 RepID=UPI001F501785|nr:sorting nexin-2 [Schistocerca americana]XP_049787993.1 sorting nexin-2 [Schistocerca cancellata]XP_049815801.1 sorting nexin-2 [Schistocerca nitens]XP_049963506.1 sorting nexin-2 [Schistocerca serialis cubense]